MAVLIPIQSGVIGTEPRQTANAQDIHAFLQVKTRYDKWITRRIETYGFLEGRDFTTVNVDQGPVRTIEYHVSIDMAKQLAMVERTEKGREARLYFIACEKVVLAQPTPPPLPSRTDELAYLGAHRDFLASLGMLEQRDKLMIADMSRNLLTAGALLPAIVPGEEPTPSMPFFIADRVRALGYQLTRKQEASLMPTLGKQVKQEYRQRYGADPHQSQRFVDGAVRLVNVYSVQDAEWIDAMVQIAVVGHPAQP